MVLSVEYALQWKIKWYSFSIWLLLQALHSLSNTDTSYEGRTLAKITYQPLQTQPISLYILPRFCSISCLTQ